MNALKSVARTQRVKVDLRSERVDTIIPAKTRHRPNAGPMSVQRLQRWSNIYPILDQRLVFAGITFKFVKNNKTS